MNSMIVVYKLDNLTRISLFKVHFSKPAKLLKINKTLIILLNILVKKILLIMF